MWNVRFYKTGVARGLASRLDWVARSSCEITVCPVVLFCPVVLQLAWLFTFWHVCCVWRLEAASYPREQAASLCFLAHSWAINTLSHTTGPSQLDLPLANKSPKMTREHATEDRDLNNPRLSHQNRAKLNFWNFQILRTKYFPKTPKTLKNLFVLELTKIEHVKTHFIKYNHTNDYGIYQT